MLSYVLFCYVLLCYVMLCYIMFCSVMFCYVTESVTLVTLAFLKNSATSFSSSGPIASVAHLTARVIHADKNREGDGDGDGVVR
jgi:hypothetical protein